MTTNVCIECGASFEVQPGLWLECPPCKKRREDAVSISLERLIAKFEPVPELADMKSDMQAARRRLLGAVYAAI